MRQPRKRQPTLSIRVSSIQDEIDFLRKAGAERTVVATEENSQTPTVLEYRLKDSVLDCIWVHRFDFKTSSHSIKQESEEPVPERTPESVG